MSESDELMQRSARTFEEAQHLFDEGYYEGCISRAYYAMFYAAQAALLPVGSSAATHAGLRTLFGKHLVKDGPFPSWMGRALGNVLDARHAADYRGARHTKPEAQEILQTVTSFAEHIQAFLDEPS